MTGVVIATPTDADENAQVQQLAEAAAGDFSARGDGQAVPVRRPRDGAALDAMARGLAAAPANRQRGFPREWPVQRPHCLCRAMARRLNARLPARVATAVADARPVCRFGTCL